MTVLFALALAAATPGASVNIGDGNTTCGEWTSSRRRTPDRVLPAAAWVLGYLSAASEMVIDRTGVDPAKGLSGAASDAWIDNYCAAHPLDNMHDASLALLSELWARAKQKQ